MTKKTNLLYLILLFVIILRIFAMVTFPLTDTTEARYAHICYLMATTNDWITPYFDVNIPFLGKPPFSFWAGAISYKIFGMHDFSARVPSLIFTLFTMYLIYKYLKTFYSKTTALWGAIIYFTFLLSFSLSGAVITDPYLAFSTSLSMIAFIMVIRNQENYWKYLFFIGIALGLLAKGPIAVVLTGGAIFLWIVFNFKNRITELKKFPWIIGTLLVLVISLPWYIIAELKTPGFLDYFIIGEHIKRFLDPSWSGDLYGTAHKKPHGEIWLFWMGASFPWGLIAIYAILKNVFPKTKLITSWNILKENSEISYFIMWSIFTMIFFTLAGNILMTYILPALSPLAILLAIYLEKINFSLKIKQYNILYIFILFVPIVVLGLNLYALKHPNKIKTEKYLIAYYKSVAKADEPLYYLPQMQFSAQYYSQDKMKTVLMSPEKRKKHSNTISFHQYEKQLKNNHENSFIAINKNNVANITSKIDRPMKKIFENKRYILFKVKGN